MTIRSLYGNTAAKPTLKKKTFVYEIVYFECIKHSTLIKVSKRPDNTSRRNKYPTLEYQLDGSLG